MKLISLESRALRSVWRRAGLINRNAGGPTGDRTECECDRARAHGGPSRRGDSRDSDSETDRARNVGPDASVRVSPWRVVRRTGELLEVAHTGETPAHSVRFALAGHGAFGLTLPCTVRPGERLRVRLGGVRDRSRSVLVMRWFEPDGSELLWPISL